MEFENEFKNNPEFNKMVRFNCSPMMINGKHKIQKSK